MSRLTSAVVFCALSACSFGPKLVRPDVDAVKKVAIVGFSGTVAVQDRQQQRGGIVGTIAGAKALSDIKSGKLDDRRHQQATQVHTMLTERLSSDLGWELAPVTSSDTLKERVRQKPTGIMVHGLQQVNELLLDTDARFLSTADRQKVIHELGVDAVMTVAMTYETGDRRGFAVGGLGSFKLFPRARVTVQMWNATQEKPVWEDSFALGQTSTMNLTENAGILEDQGETEALMDAAKLGVEELIARYRAAPNKG